MRPLLKEPRDGVMPKIEDDDPEDHHIKRTLNLGTEAKLPRPSGNIPTAQWSLAVPWPNRLVFLPIVVCRSYWANCGNPQDSIQRDILILAQGAPPIHSVPEKVAEERRAMTAGLCRLSAHSPGGHVLPVTSTTWGRWSFASVQIAHFS